MSRPKGIPDAEVLAEARRCFLRYGPGVSTETIAAGLSLSQPALFKTVRHEEGAHDVRAPSAADPGLGRGA